MKKYSLIIILLLATLLADTINVHGYLGEDITPGVNKQLVWRL